VSHFDEIAHDYDESLPPHVVEHYLAKRAEFIHRHVPRGKILDVGCGTGALAQRLADQGYDVTGVDPSDGMLDVLRERAPGITAVHADGTDLPFEDGSFDLAYCVAVMHHVAAPAAVHKTLGEMVRVTRSGGRVLIWDHNPRNPYWRNLMGRVPQDTGEERLIPEDELLDGLRDGGAEPLLSEQLGFVPDFVAPRLLPLAQRTERAVERIPGLRRVCAHNVILAAAS
jgi:SAM-dependent methyltransferase